MINQGLERWLGRIDDQGKKIVLDYNLLLESLTIKQTGCSFQAAPGSFAGLYDQVTVLLVAVTRSYQPIVIVVQGGGQGDELGSQRVTTLQRADLCWGVSLEQARSCVERRRNCRRRAGAV